MRLNSSSLICLSAHSSADTYLHRPIFFVRTFKGGNFGFFVIFFFVDVDAWGEHGGTAMAVSDGVVALSALDIIVFVVAALEEDSGIGVGGVTGRLASNARLRSCLT
jgi:hypothetical protein